MYGVLSPEGGAGTKQVSVLGVNIPGRRKGTFYAERQNLPMRSLEKCGGMERDRGVKPVCKTPLRG